MKRVKKVDEIPNPLFLQWLTEMKVEAEQKGNVNGVTVYRKCITSLEKYPLPFENGKQCKVLNGFGTKICEMLDKRLEIFRKNNNKALNFPVSPVAANTSPVASKISSITARKLSPVASKLSPIKARASPVSPKPSPLKPLDNFDEESRNGVKKKTVKPIKSSVFDESWHSDCDEDRDLKLALQLSQVDTKNNLDEEDKDLQFALKLSQADFNKSNGKEDLERSQEEDDHELALRLQKEWNNSPSPQRNDNDDLPDIPDNSFELPDIPENHYDDLPEPIERPPESSAINPRVKRLANVHNISSSEDSFNVENNAHEELDNAHEELDEDPMDRLFASDPVFRKAANAGLGESSKPKKKTLAKAVNPQVKKLAVKHNISTSDESFTVENDAPSGSKKKALNSMDNLFANDPVFNRASNAASDSNEASPRPNSRLNKTPKTPKSKGKKGPKEYVPKPRSGAYALLVTLYKESCKDGYPGYMNRVSLQTDAQPLSDQSFVSKNAHSEFYTAWSGMKTLVKNELVKKWSNPAKYDITEKGQRLAAKIVKVEMGEEVLDETNNDGAAMENEVSVGRGKNKKTPTREKGKRKENTPAKTPPKRQRLDNTDHPDISELRKRRIDALSGKNAPEPDLEPSYDNERDESSGVGVNDEDSDLAKALRLSLLDSKTDQSVANFDLDVSNFSPGIEQPKASSSRPPASSFSRSSSSSSHLAPSSSSSGLREENLPMAFNLKRHVSNPRPLPGVDSHQPEFKLKAGSFDILLCVDNTEVAGGGAGGRKSLKVETVRHLEEHNVPYNKRNLNIGDFLWIARERVEEVEGQFRQKQPRELVLPYLVERKRLDDLWMSVKDGRYEEQKFRMQSSGSVYLYYLVEDFKIQHSHWGQGAHGNMVTPESIEQAVANTAAQQGFSIARTRDQRATVEYLTIFTRLLRRKYEGKELSSCTHLDLAEDTVVNKDTTLLTFTEFNDTSKKNKKLTLREVFAKMLLRLKGLSVEMAHSITQKYPTPRALKDAYNKAGSEANKIKLINEMTYGIEGKRKIPKNIAEAMVTFWTKNNIN